MHPQALGGVLVLIGALVVACVPPPRAASGRSAPPTPPAMAIAMSPALGDADYLRGRRLMVPVHGVAPSQVRDDFDARRGTRRHNALDIMAPRGTPVLSTDDGRVLSMRRNTSGGITVYVVDVQERMVYYYAHMERYRRRLSEGDRVRKGDVLGYVGTTGNAPSNAPHLHFQALRLGDPRRYWEGAPVNPHPYLVVEGRKRD